MYILNLTKIVLLCYNTTRTFKNKSTKRCKGQKEEKMSMQIYVFEIRGLVGFFVGVTLPEYFSGGYINEVFLKIAKMFGGRSRMATREETSLIKDRGLKELRDGEYCSYDGKFWLEGQFSLMKCRCGKIEVQNYWDSYCEKFGRQDRFLLFAVDRPC